MTVETIRKNASIPDTENRRPLPGDAYRAALVDATHNLVSLSSSLDEYRGGEGGYHRNRVMKAHGNVILALVKVLTHSS